MQGHVQWTPDLEQQQNNNNQIFGGNNNSMFGTDIIYLALSKNSSFRYLIKSKHFTKNMLKNFRFQHNKNSLMQACTMSSSAVEAIINSKLCDQELIDHRDDNLLTCFMVAAAHSNQALSLLINSNFCNNDILTAVDNKNISCIMHAAQQNTSSVSVLLDSKWINDAMLSQTDDNGNNIIMLSIMNDSHILEKLIEKNLLTKDLMKITNKEGMNILMISAKNNSESLNRLLSINNLIDEQYVIIGNPLHKNYNAMMYAAQYNGSSVTKINQSQWGRILMKIKDSEGNTPLMIACQYNPHNLPNIVNSDICTDDIYGMTNNQGQNCFMIIVKYQKIGVDYMLQLNQYKHSKKFIEMVDNDGNNLAMYFIEYYPDKLDEYLRQDLFEIKHLKAKNKNGQDSLIFACSKSTTSKNIVSRLLEIISDKDLLKITDNEGNNALMTACLNNFGVYDILFADFRMSQDIIMCRNKQHMTILMLACMKRKQCATHILDSCWIDYEYISQVNDIGMNAFMIACQYMPDIMVDILDKISSFGNIELTQFLSAKGTQLMSSPPDHLQYMFNEKYYGFTGLHLCAIYNPEYIKSLLPFISDEVGLIKDSNKKRYYEYVCEGESNATCQICFSNRKNYAIDCGHIFCEMCTHVDKCYMCKTPITSRKKVYI